MRLCNTIGYLEQYGKSPADAVRMLEGTGFRHIDYSFYDTLTDGNPFLSDNWMQVIADAGKAAEQLGFDFVQAHSPNYNPLAGNPAHDERGLLATKRSIEACGYLGIRNMVLHTGYSLSYRYPDDREQYLEANRAFLNELTPLMERYNVNILIENTTRVNMGERYFPITGQDMIDFIRGFGHPLLHACWDVGHANCEPLDQYEEIVTMGSELRAIHFQDNMGHADEHIAPYMGTLDIDSVLQGLIAIDYKGYFTFECDNMLAQDGAWPHSRKKSSHTTERPAANFSAAVAKKGLELLYEIGKHILTCYGLYED